MISYETWQLLFHFSLNCESNQLSWKVAQSFSMICFKIHLVCATFFAVLCERMVPIYHERYEDCYDNTKTSGDIFDFSEIEIAYINETHQYYNGSWRFANDIVAPWDYKFYSEKYVGRQWQRTGPMIHKTDFCAVMHDPNGIWYHAYKNFKGCPISKGVRSNLRYQKTLKSNQTFAWQDDWYYDMVRIEYTNRSLSSHGRWRSVVKAEVTVDGELKTQCYMIRYELIYMPHLD